MAKSKAKNMIEGKKVSIVIEGEVERFALMRLTTKQAVAALRLLRLKMHTQKLSQKIYGRDPHVEHIREIFWEKENGQFHQATIQGMLNSVLSWDNSPTREDVIYAINLLLESACTNPKGFSSRYL